MKFNSILVALNSSISPGAFSGERIFEVKLANGKPYRSVAPREFCWNTNGDLVDENEPMGNILGKVAARIVDTIDDDQIVVETPDGQCIAVDLDIVEERPTPVKVSSSYRNYVSV